MNRRGRKRPEGAYESGVAGFWPNFREEDERLYDLQRAYTAATSDRQMVAVEGPGPERVHLEWQAIPPSTTRPLIRIVCSHPDHGHGQPMLAELWHTDDHGPIVPVQTARRRGRSTRRSS